MKCSECRYWNEVKDRTSRWYGGQCCRLAEVVHRPGGLPSCSFNQKSRLRAMIKDMECNVTNLEGEAAGLNALIEEKEATITDLNREVQIFGMALSIASNEKQNSIQAYSDWLKAARGDQ